MNMNSPERNWAGNFAYAAARIHRPDSVKQIQAIVADVTRPETLCPAETVNQMGATLSGAHFHL